MRRANDVADAYRKLGLVSPRERQVLNTIMLGRQSKVIAFEFGTPSRSIRASALHLQLVGRHEVHRIHLHETLAAASAAVFLLSPAILAQQPASPTSIQAGPGQPPPPQGGQAPPMGPVETEKTMPSGQREQTRAPAITYRPVTAEMLQKPADGDWLMYRRTYDGHGFSPLSQINPSNVKRLTAVWSFATGMVEGHQSPPIVVNGMMFVTTPQNQVLALDAKSGDLIWRFRRPVPEDMMQLHATNRGVAVFGDKVYFATQDAYVVALDAKIGNEVWATPVDYTQGYYMTLAPIVADGKVMVGVSGGELGIRGFVTGLDAESGKVAWKTYTIPEPGAARKRDMAKE